MILSNERLSNKYAYFELFQKSPRYLEFIAYYTIKKLLKQLHRN
jgi:hypothetical protein